MQQPRRISFDDFARELGPVLDGVRSEKRPVLVEKEGWLFRVEEEQLHQPADIWAGYDPEAVRAGLRRSAGAFRGLDRDTFLADVKEQREQDGRQPQPRCPTSSIPTSPPTTWLWPSDARGSASNCGGRASSRADGHWT